MKQHRNGGSKSGMSGTAQQRLTDGRWLSTTLTHTLERCGFKYEVEIEIGVGDDNLSRVKVSKSNRFGWVSSHTVGSYDDWMIRDVVMEVAEFFNIKIPDEMWYLDPCYQN